MSTVTNIDLILYCKFFFSLSLFYGQWRISRNERDGTGDAKRIVRGECDRCFLESLADEGAALGFRVCAKLAQNSFTPRNSHWYDGRLGFHFWPIMETFF